MFDRRASIRSTYFVKVGQLLCCLLLWSTAVFAQESYSVINWDSRTTWNKYLIQKMHAQYHQRDEITDHAFTSLSTLKKYQERINDRFQQILGSFLSKTPLNAQTTDIIQRDGYRIEKVVYESFANHHVTANLYVPDGEGPFPGILFFCGHERTAKATPSYQRSAILLAKNGFVVLVIDPISQSERFQLTDEQGKPATRGGTTEHTLLNVGSLLVGTSVMNYEYWDNKRGLDYLMSRPEVDTTRIGVLGNSGGGTMTTYFLAINDEIDAAAISSFITTRERSLEEPGPQDGCQWIPYEGQQRLELSDYLMMNAPVPTLILAGRYDFFDYVGTRRAYAELKQFYTTLGAPEQVKLFTWADGHGISKPKREAAVQWFRRWFYDDSSKVEEGHLSILSPKQLQVTKTGQVASSYPNEYAIQERNLDLAHQLEDNRQQFQDTHSPEEFTNKLKALLGFEKNINKVETEPMGIIGKDDFEVHKIVLRKKGTVPVPLLVIYPPKQETSNKVVVWFSEEGKKAIITDQKRLQKYLNAGNAIVLADVRGVGELEDPEAFNAAKYYDDQYRNDQISLHIGKPVVGQRVQDIFTVLDFIDQTKSLANLRVEVHASGFVASPALHAATFTSQIDHLFLHNTIRSYMDLLENPTMKNGYAYLVPNGLKYYDLPVLVAHIGPEKITYKTSKGNR